MRRAALATALLALGALAVPARGAPPPQPSPDVLCSEPAPGGSALLVGVLGAGRGWLAGRMRAYGATVGPRLAPLDVHQVQFPDRRLVPAATAALRRDPRVRLVEADAPLRATETPSDPMLRRQWGLAKVGAQAAWNVEVGTTPVDVAVLDTGVDPEHPDLATKLVGGANFVDPGAPPHDDNVHGTHVAGIVAAATNNRRGIAGMSWGARIVPVKVLDAAGGGTACRVVAGIVYAASRNVRVVNMSLGAPLPCPAAMQQAIDLAHSRGAVLVASAGNEGDRANLTNTPANCEHVLGVAATDPKDRTATFSNYGSYVDVAAPGVAILSTALDPESGVRGYAALSGTSMAAPMVAGLAALLAARHPEWTPDQVADRILRTSVDLGRRGWDPHFGQGRIDARRALAS